MVLVCSRASKEDWLLVQEIIEAADTLLKIDCVRFDQLPYDEKFRKNILAQKIILFKRGKHMLTPTTTDVFQSLGDALNRLKEAVQLPTDKNRMNIDASIHRFEFCIELYWKVLRCLLQQDGVTVPYPKQTLKEAYRGKLIDNESFWLQMMEDRNKSSHIYSQNAGEALYERIKIYCPEMQKTYDRLKKRYFFENS